MDSGSGKSAITATLNDYFRMVGLYNLGAATMPAIMGKGQKLTHKQEQEHFKKRHTLEQLF
jgi:hypothetical protein